MNVFLLITGPHFLFDFFSTIGFVPDKSFSTWLEQTAFRERQTSPICLTTRTKTLIHVTDVLTNAWFPKQGSRPLMLFTERNCPTTFKVSSCHTVGPGHVNQMASGSAMEVHKWTTSYHRFPFTIKCIHRPSDSVKLRLNLRRFC